jgi:acetyltransferase
MPASEIAIRRVERPLVPRELQSMCSLLIDAVDTGASVGFLWPLRAIAAQRYWQGVERALASGELSLWVAQDGDGTVIGTVQIELCGKENGGHRAELQKLLVHSSRRRGGVGAALIATAEQYAVAIGRSLLVLDTQVGSAAEMLYQRSGWTRAAEIPNFAASPDGELHSTVYYYKSLRIPKSAL